MDFFSSFLTFGDYEGSGGRLFQDVEEGGVDRYIDRCAQGCKITKFCNGVQF